MMEGGARSRTWRLIAAVVFLCSLVLSLTYFSFRERFRSVERDENISETVPLELMKGSVFFNGEELVENELLASSTQSGHKEMEDDVAVADWRLLNASLHCGRDEFRFKAVGPDAADLTLEMSNSDRLPLTQVPGACGFSVTQTALGLVLHVPFDGCSVRKANEMYVLTLRWRENAVSLTCAALASSEEITATSQSLQQPEGSASSEPQSRPRRHLRWQNFYSPCSQHRSFPLCWRTTTPPTTTTTTAAPAMPAILSPQLLSRFLRLYPIYEQYLQNHPQVKLHLNAHKHPGWQMYKKMTARQKPQHLYPDPLQFILKQHFQFTTTDPATTTVRTTTPCGKTTTPSGLDCPGSQRWFFPFRKHNFSPRVSFNSNDLSSSLDGGYDTRRYDTRDQVTPDSLWESFPLMH
nr:uncharacterized protein LOC107383997 [Nothobranchius furzeri]